MVIMVEVPVVWEVAPGGGLVTLSTGATFLFGLIGLGLILQDLGDEPMVGLGGDEDGWDLQQFYQLVLASQLLAFVFLDTSGLGSGQGGSWQWWVGIMTVTPFGWWGCWWEWVRPSDGGGDEGLVVVGLW